jgi:Immunity protein 26
MKRRKDGNVHQIPLHPHYDGYAYGKYIDITKHTEKTTYGELLLVSDKIFQIPQLNIEDNWFDELLMNPIYITGASAIMKIFPCVANFSVKSDDQIFPYLRMPRSMFDEDLGIEIKEWDIMNHEHKILNSLPYTLKEVAHLSSLSSTTYIDYLNFAISFALYRSKGTFMPKKVEFDWIQNLVYDKESKTTPFKDVPVEKRFWVEIK